MADFKPSSKERGNVILAQDWNSAMTEIVRLSGEVVSLNEQTVRRTGGVTQGDLNLAGTITAGGKIGIGTTSPRASVDIRQATRTGDHPSAVKGLYVTGELGQSSDGVEFRHSNGSQGVGFGYNTIYATGSNADQDLNLLPRGNGKVGIGTVTPNQKLSVSGAEATAHGFGAAVGLSNTATGGAKWYLRVGATGTNTPAGGFSIADDAAYRVVIDIAGNVGIGTNSPAAKLEVNGTVKAAKYEGDGSALKGIDALSKSGGTVTGALSVDQSLAVKGEIKAASYVGDGSKLTGIAGGPWAVKDGALSYSGGSVGIGTDKPTQVLEVNGTVKAGKFEGDGSGLTGISAAAPAESKWADVTDGIQYKAGKKVLIGVANSGTSLQVINKNQDPSGDTFVVGRSDGSHLRLGYDTGYVWIQSATDKSLAINPLGGKVGVGTTDPQAALDVAGSAIVMRQPVDPQAVSALLDKLPNGALIIGGPSGDTMAFYWKDENGNKLRLKLKGEALT